MEPSEYVVHEAERLGGPWLVLVGIILSQNTSDRNSIEALRRYAREIGPRPEDALRRSPEEIGRAIRVAGAWRRKARAIREAARLVAESGGEEWLLRAPPGEVRERLQGVEGIGPKTVDVFLSFVRRVPVFPVDTHARRIAWRWGLVDSPRAPYERVSRALAEYFKGHDYERAHKLLISFGRRYCRARQPRCGECPLRECCPYARGLLPRPGPAGRRGRGRSSGTR